MACQSTCRWATQEKSLDIFAQHFHRALLQYVTIDCDLLPHIKSHREIIVGPLSRTSKSNGWITYARNVFKKWNIDGPSDEILSSYYERFQPHAKEIAIIWTLRALIAASLESLILMDRLAFLDEWIKTNQQDLDVQLIPLFEPVHSPRNMGLIIRKPAQGPSSTLIFKNGVETQ